MAKINLWRNLSTVWWSCQSLKVQLLIKTNAPDSVFSETSDSLIPHDLCYHMQHHNIPAGGAASLQKFFLRVHQPPSLTLLLQRSDPKKRFEYFTLVEGLFWWLSSRESACQCRWHGFDPWVGKILWRRKWHPTPVFLPGKSHAQEFCGLQSVGLQGVRHDSVTKQQHP